MTKSGSAAQAEAKARLDARLDEALAETFPASDPVAVSAPEGAKARPLEASTTLRDNREAHRFELHCDGAVAVAYYEAAPGVITITHTEVPKELRGKGIGSVLAKAVLEAVRGRGLKIVPQCPFFADFIARNPESGDLLA